MAQTFFEDLETAMYPSALLHTFGVNGKVSGLSLIHISEPTRP